MNRSHTTTVIALLAALAVPLCVPARHSTAADNTPTVPGDVANEAVRLFQSQIQPLLVQQCLGCHNGADDAESSLDLRSREAMLAGGESGQPAIVPGNAEQSLLYRAVTWDDEQLQMPPKQANRLTAEQVAMISRWIAAGAPWPAPPSTPNAASADAWTAGDPSGVRVATSGGLSPEWTNRTYRPEDLWAYQPVRRYPVPRIADNDESARPAHPIDAFLQAAQRDKGLAPARRADPVTLIRRATLDLTGLPPAPDEVATFTGDPSADAFAKLIERLLASPHYGEQWGRHWLDVVRYADTSGYSNDYERPNAWRYRDYVVRSFNQDKPFDRFIVEQIAGDELDPHNPELLIAAGFLRMGPWEHTSMSVAAVTRQMFLDDVTDNVGQVFLAHGLRCASCHDHKFDPVPTRDYYRLQAVFAPVAFADRAVDFLPVENTADFAHHAARAKSDLADTKARLKAVLDKQQQAIADYLKQKGVNKVDELPEHQRPNRNHFGLSPQEMGLAKVYRKRIALEELALRRTEPLAFSVASGGLKHEAPVDDVHILQGGSLASPADKVTPGVLSAVHGSNDQLAPTAWNSIPATTVGRRLALAGWIASPQNPLTARVMVNRIWQHHFGRGLVETSNNFGKMGKRPAHPELLDWLAQYFVDHGWSVKAMHRLIMTSEAYRQSSDHPQVEQLRRLDPNNDLWCCFQPRRLTAEELRDAMLAASGLLSRTMGGPPVYPEINQEAALQPRHIMGNMAPAYVPSPRREQRNRRTIYTVQIRNLVNPMLEVFNLPGSEASCQQRDETTVTPQVFALFNGQAVHDAALAMARRLESLAAEPAARLEAAFRLAYGRPPTPSEQTACLDHVARLLRHHRQTEPLRVAMPTSVERTMVEELTGETFRFIEPLNLHGYEPNLKPWDVGPETRAWAELCLVLFNSNEFVYVY